MKTEQASLMYPLPHRGGHEAFTLIEILIVVSLLAMLATVGAIQVARTRIAAREQLALVNLRTLAKACQFFFIAVNQYPLDLTHLGPPTSDPPYLDGTLTQPSPVKQGYVFTYVRPLPEQFTLTADPQIPGVTGVRCFFVDESMVVRGSETCPATSTSPVIP